VTPGPSRAGVNLHSLPGISITCWPTSPGRTEQILYALDRIPRTLWRDEDIGRVHLSLSGTLLETLSGSVLPGAGLRGRRLRRPAVAPGRTTASSPCWGSGTYHPGTAAHFPPPTREEHLSRWRGIGPVTCSGASDSRLSGRRRWGSALELIPLLRRFGYRYVLVDQRPRPRR